MQRRHTGQCRNGDLKQRLARLAGDDKNDRHHQHQAHFEKQGQANHHCHQCHHPRQGAAPGMAQQSGGDLVRCSGFRHQGPEHRAQGNDDPGLPQNAACAFAECLGDHFWRQPGTDPGNKGTDQNRKKRRELADAD